MEITECGAAALAMILGYYGCHVPLDELRVKCGVSRDGSKASDIVKAARQYGLKARGMQMDISFLAAQDRPVIIFWGFYHFVVWEGFGRVRGKRVVYLNDPAYGKRTESFEEFDQNFTGVVLTFQPTSEFVPSGRKPGGWHTLRGRLGGVSGMLATAMIAGAMLLVTGMAEAGLVRTVIGSALGAGNGDLRAVIVFALVLLVLALSLAVLQANQLRRARVRAAVTSTASFTRHLLHLPLPFVQQRNSADLTQRVGSNGLLASTLVHTVATLATAAVALTSYLFLLFLYDPKLIFACVLIIFCHIALTRRVIRLRANTVSRVRIDEAIVAQQSYSGVQLIESIKSTGQEREYFRRWLTGHTRYLNGKLRAERPVALLHGVMPAVPIIAAAVLLLIGSVDVVGGGLAVSALAASQLLLGEIEVPVDALVSSVPPLQDATADAAKLKDLEIAKPDPAFSIAASNRFPSLTGQVEVRGVGFGYATLSPPIIDDLSFVVRPAEQLAIVGGSGSGKSTVAKLLTGQVEAWHGRIVFDGIDRSAIDTGTIAKTMGYVDQNISLFGGTVRENLSLGNTDLGDEAMVAALRDVAMYEEVLVRRGGLDARVEQDGRNFSGGQRQRLEIARALAGEPKLIVLDEATSALDSITEQIVLANLRRRGCAQVIIAHRLSTVRTSREILVLDRGRVVERGTHAGLLESGGQYAKLLAGSVA